MRPTLEKRRQAIREQYASQTIICMKCGKPKLGSEFYVHYDKRPDTFRLKPDCIACIKARTKVYEIKNRDKVNLQRRLYYRLNRTRVIATNTAYRERNIERIHKWTIKRLYGLTEQEHADILKRQKGVCAICQNPPAGSKHQQRLHVDHDHKTGFVRGLLCALCNASLRFIEDDFLLIRAIGYIEKSKKRQKEIISGSSSVFHRAETNGKSRRHQTQTKRAG